MDQIVLSGSQNGVIKAWKIPHYSQIEPFGPNKDCSYNFATWENLHDNETIWDIRVHETENIFISVGADASISLCQVPFPS